MSDLLASLSGPIALLPTFFAGARLDCAAQIDHALRLSRNDCRTMVLGGAEGEGPTLSDAETEQLLRVLCGLPGPLSIGLAIWTPCTRTAQLQAIRAQEAGAAFLVVSAPPYNKPTQRGICRHVEAVLESTSLPVMLRDEPVRTRIGIGDEVLAGLYRTRLAAIALAPGDIRRATIIRHSSRGRIPLLVGSDFDAILGQCDAGEGWLSSLVNIDPVRCRDIQRARLRDDWRTATLLSRDLCRLLRALDLAEPAVTVKYALSHLGRTGPETRLPLVPLPTGPSLVIDTALHVLGLVEESTERRAAAS